MQIHDLISIDPRVVQLEPIARSRISHDDPSHDWSHIVRVMQNCVQLASDVGADPEILLPAAMLHDLVNVPKNHPNRHTASRMGASYYDIADTFAEQRDLDDKRHMLDHFYTNLFKLAEGFHTEPGRQEASRRTAFMHEFIAQLRREI